MTPIASGTLLAQCLGLKIIKFFSYKRTGLLVLSRTILIVINNRMLQYSAFHLPQSLAKENVTAMAELIKNVFSIALACQRAVKEKLLRCAQCYVLCQN